ncbi:MAG: hypothetical protein CTY33_04995 [Methylotenera sp.]|nr:MAG: hypothetical protein CTY33_04995 [Methylotenera sp.]
MKPINAITLSGFTLTAIAIYVLGYFPFIPAWPIFITWACFFHMDGGINKNQAFFATLRHICLGAFASWMSALAVMNNPFSGAIADQLWAPVLIAAAIALLMRLSTVIQFSVTPAIIYGYALIWAFLSVPGLFDQEILLSLTFKNAIIAIVFSVLLGACAGYMNAMMVNFLCNLKLRKLP